jgi:hypothetical protein
LYAAAKERGFGWHFGAWEGAHIFYGGGPRGGGLGDHYQDVVGQDFFRLARWELWQVA